MVSIPFNDFDIYHGLNMDGPLEFFLLKLPARLLSLLDPTIILMKTGSLDFGNKI